MNTNEPYNPLEKSNLGASVANKLINSEFHKLPPEPFIGAGVYAIYYKGSYSPYSKYRKLENDIPIYVGKAVPKGARKGGLGSNPDHGKALFNRLTDHFNSIDKAENLDAKDFFCKYLVVDDIWIPLAESLLIERFKPLWNTTLEGFGNHAPGKGRNLQQKSSWDTLHPGRPWARNLPDNQLTQIDLENRVRDYLEKKY